MTGQRLGSLPLPMYKVIAAYKPEDTTIAMVLLYLRKSGHTQHPWLLRLDNLANLPKYAVHGRAYGKRFVTKIL